MLKTQLVDELQKIIGDGIIDKTDFEVSEVDGLLTVTMNAQCTEDIALEIPATTTYEKTGDCI